MCNQKFISENQLNTTKLEESMNYEEKIKELTDIQRTRDNLKLKAHLFKEEAKDIWEETEEKLEQYEKKLKLLQQETKSSSKDIGTAINLLKDELQEGYKKLKKIVS